MKSSTKIKLQLWLLRILGYLAVLIPLGLVAYFRNKVFETIIIMLSYTLLRWCFPTTWHAKTVISCICYSILIFYCCIEFAMPITLSLFSSICVSLILTFVLYKLQKLIENQKPPRKDIYAMSKDELYNWCHECGLDDIECKIAYYVVIERLKGKDLANAIGYSEIQTKRKRSKILKTIK